MTSNLQENFPQKMFKIITMRNEHKCKYTMQFAMCAKSMELFELYSKKKTIFFA